VQSLLEHLLHLAKSRLTLQVEILVLLPSLTWLPLLGLAMGWMGYGKGSLAEEWVH
jgi:hypothetical protein